MNEAIKAIEYILTSENSTIDYEDRLILEAVLASVKQDNKKAA